MYYSNAGVKNQQIGSVSWCTVCPTCVSRKSCMELQVWINILEVNTDKKKGNRMLSVDSIIK